MAFNSRFGQVAYAAGTKTVAVTKYAYPIRNIAYTTENIAQIVNDYNFGMGISGPDRPGSQFNETSFDMELIGQDTADGTTPHGALWRAAGARETQQSTTPTIAYKYTFYNEAAGFRLLANSGDVDPIDLTVSVGETLDAAAANMATDVDDAVCRSMSITFRQNEIPYVSYNFVGKEDESVSTKVLSGWVAGSNTTWNKPADPVNADNLSLTVGGVTLVVRSFVINVNNTVNQRPDRNKSGGYNDPMITGRDINFVLEYETVPIATFSPNTLFKAQTKQAYSLIYNAAGGYNNKLTITGDAFVTGAAQIAPDADNISVSTITLKQSDISGDELDLAFSTT